MTILALLCSPTSCAQSSPVTIVYGRSWPRSIVIDSARGVAYIDGMSGDYPATGFSFGIINTTSHALEPSVLGLNVTAGEMALDPASGDVYVAGADSIQVFNGGMQSFTRLMNVGVPIRYILFDSVTGDLFLTANNAVYQFDPRTGTMLRNATVGTAAEGMAIDTSTGEVYVADYLSCSIVVLKTASLESVTTIRLPTPCYPSQMALDQQTRSLYIASGSNTVDVVNTVDNIFERSTTVAADSTNATFAIALQEGTGNVFTLTEPGTTVTQIDGSTGSVVGRFQLTSVAYEMAVDQATGELYVSVYHDVMVFEPLHSQSWLTLPVVAGLAAAALAVMALSLVLIRRRSKQASGGRLLSACRPTLDVPDYLRMQFPLPRAKVENCGSFRGNRVVAMRLSEHSFQVSVYLPQDGFPMDART